ncbi:MAG TPA: efflux RND transporter periplasmic adaptor subunit [Polyangiaceae bacterium]
MTATTKVSFRAPGPYLLTLLAAGAVACARAEASPTPTQVTKPVAVTTTDVAERAMPKWLTVTGTLVGNRESEVAADVSGRVLDTNVERGSVVARGAVLAKLDGRTAMLTRREASARAAAARVERDTAKLECERAEQLYRANAISRSELDRTRASCQSSDHTEQAALARQSMAEKDLVDSTIRAPFSGMIVERNVSVGEFVNVGTRIATVVELNPLRLELTVPELASTAVQVGNTVRFELKAFPNEHFSGKIRYVGPVLRRATRDLVVEALVENPEHRLRPGMFAEAQLRLGEERLPVIPKTALAGAEPSLRAFVVKQGVVEERVVLAGNAEGDSIAILKGLNVGERIVTHPTAEVKDGVRVR